MPSLTPPPQHRAKTAPDKEQGQLVQKLKITFHLSMTETWETIRAAQTSLMRSEAPTLSLTVLAAARQEPKGCTYFACSSPDWYQKKTSRIRDCKSTIHNHHTQARSINSRAFRRKDVHVQAVIHSLPSSLTEAHTHHPTRAARHTPTVLRWHPWAFHP